MKKFMVTAAALASLALSAAAIVAGCGSRDRGTPASAVVSGRTLVEGTAEGVSCMALDESVLPLNFFVQEQAFGNYSAEIAEGSSDDQGRFTLRADLEDLAATSLILYAKCDRIGCSAPGGCVYKRLPPLRRGDERWVVKSTGRPLNVTVRIGVDQPNSPCY